LAEASWHRAAEEYSLAGREVAAAPSLVLVAALHQLQQVHRQTTDVVGQHVTTDSELPIDVLHNITYNITYMIHVSAQSYIQGCTRFDYFKSDLRNLNLARARFAENLFWDHRTICLMELIVPTMMSAATKRQYSSVLPLLRLNLPVFHKICGTAVDFLLLSTGVTLTNSAIAIVMHPCSYCSGRTINVLLID